MSAVPRDHARAAYDVFAAFYDEFTSHHRYPEWTASLEALAVAAGLRGRRLLDVGCGTGKSFEPMLARGYDVTACDISPAMVARARRKAAGRRARVLVRDMRALGELGTFDLIWSLCDAINYLHSEEELVATFRGVAANLAPGGVFLFDVNTLATFRTLGSTLMVMPSAERVLVLEGQGDAHLESGGAVECWIDRLTPNGDGAWTRVRSINHHRHHPIPTLRRALEAAGLELVSVHGNHLDGRMEPHLDELRHSKAVLVARTGG